MHREPPRTGHAIKLCLRSAAPPSGWAGRLEQWLWPVKDGAADAAAAADGGGGGVALS